MVSRQAELSLPNDGYVLLEPGHNFEQALEDLAGFERIWLIYWFHRNSHWKPKVHPPRGGPKRGVFATRSPHRPNPIGMSCVTLLSIEGRKLWIGNNDLVNGTPILDIKPYLNYADAFPGARQGWLEACEEIGNYTISWSSIALEQACFILERTFFDLKQVVEGRLRENPFPFPNHRITQISKDTFVLACKTWRTEYKVKGNVVDVEKIASGYDAETLAGLKPSRWNDVEIHREFLQRYKQYERLAE